VSAFITPFVGDHFQYTYLTETCNVFKAGYRLSKAAQTQLDTLWIRLLCRTGAQRLWRRASLQFFSLSSLWVCVFRLLVGLCSICRFVKWNFNVLCGERGWFLQQIEPNWGENIVFQGWVIFSTSFVLIWSKCQNLFGIYEGKGEFSNLFPLCIWASFHIHMYWKCTDWSKIDLWI